MKSVVAGATSRSRVGCPDVGILRISPMLAALWGAPIGLLVGLVPTALKLELRVILIISAVRIFRGH